MAAAAARAARGVRGRVMSRTNQPLPMASPAAMANSRHCKIQLSRIISIQRIGLKKLMPGG